MNFLNVGPWELMVILIIAILLVGPRRVVEIIQAVRRFAGQLRGMSNEFTSLMQTEILTSEQETGPAPVDVSGDESIPVLGGDDTSQKPPREPEGLQDIIREGLEPLIGIQAELQATARETREALESVVKDGLEPIAGIQAELQDATQEARQALETPIQDKPEPTSGIPQEAVDEQNDETG